MHTSVSHSVPADLSAFWVVTVLSNPVRYKRRYELYWRFKEFCRQAGVKLITVEQAFGNRPFMVTEASDPYALQIRSFEELWHKENMITLGVKHACAIAPALGLQVREVAWVDADCRSARTPRDWFEETWHQLQHYQFVQMWEWILDLDVHQNPVGVPGPSFMGNYLKYGHPYPPGVGSACEPYSQAPKQWGSPGLAWAANIEALNQIGGIPDYAILGAGDWYLAHMLVSQLDIKGMKNYSPGYLARFQRQQELCARWIKKDVGCVSGFVLHDWHGKKVNRGYSSREQIFIQEQYNPDTDIKPDIHGMHQLETWEPRQIRLRDKIRAYFRARNEDGIDV